MSLPSEIEIYQFRMYLREISPMIWRRLLLRSDHTIADLHYTLQIAMGWDDFHLHQFTIRGKRHGVSRVYGRTFSRMAVKCRCTRSSFGRMSGFSTSMTLGIVGNTKSDSKKTLLLDPKKTYPVCIGGRRAAPQEDCGGPWAFMALKDHFNIIYIADRLQEIMEMEPEDRDYYYEEVHEFMYWLQAHKFDRRTVNKHLRWYATGDKRWREWTS